MRLLYPVVLATGLLLALSASAEDEESLSRSKRQAGGSSIRGRARRRSNINVENIRSTSIQVGFNYIGGAKGYLITAMEYSVKDRKVTQTVATSQSRVDEHGRQGTLNSLHPGRDYLIEVQALNSAGRLIGSRASGVVKTALRCYVCDGRASNNECKGRNNIQECPRGTDSCLNELRYQNGITTVTKRCTQFRPEFATKFRSGADAVEACQGTIARDSFCFCACKSDLCNAQELPCATRCFPELERPSGGSIGCTDSNRGGSVCTWSCNGGRELVGVDSSRCRRDGTWTVITPPQCVRKVAPTPGPPKVFECPELNNPRNGRVSCTITNQPGSVCSISCNPGFELTGGTARRTCARNGRWTASGARCTRVTCPEIKPASIRQMTCTDGNRMGSECKFTCKKPYTLNGAESVTCERSGKWSKFLPRCLRQGCFARPRTSPNVMSKCEDVTEPEEGAICSYSCATGYRLNGKDTQRCTKNKWTGSPPTCTRVRCRPALAQPANGYVQCSSGQFATSVCTFRCQNNFALVGRRSVTCLETGEWSSREPRCRRVECPPVGDFSDGSYSCNNANGIGSVCSFQCNAGFGIPSRSRRRITCRAPTVNADPDAEYPGRWSYPIPRCEKARCTDRALTKGLSRTCTAVDHREVGSICTFRCIPGYSVAGRTRIECQRNRFGYSNGRWLTDNPFCIRRQCESRVIISGVLNCTDRRFAGSRCTVVCDHGYQATGDPDVECGIDGRWSSRISQCTRVVCLESDTSRFRTQNLQFSCGRPQQSTRGVRRYYTDHQCSVGCRVGYDIRGGNTSTCGNDGQWKVPSQVVCEDRNECDDRNGNCDQTCLNMDGSFRCECKKNYRLAPDRRTCILTVCPELNQDPQQRIDCSKGRLIGSRCRLSCVVGYEPKEGSSLLNCLEDGSWNRNQAKCTKVECAFLRAPSHGSLSCTTANSYQSVCTSSCDEGYELVGERETECMSTKAWTNPIPRCRKIQCPEENTMLGNGRVECSDANFYKSQCNYFCNPGYEYDMSGSLSLPFAGLFLLPSSTCQSDSSWSDPAPRCVKSSCSPSVEAMEEERPNSAISCSDGSLFESTCGIVCEIGYALNGHRRTTCSESKTWTQDLGACEKVQCSEYTPLLNGLIECTDVNFYRSQCSFHCAEGYNLIGTPTTTCLSDRSWSVPRPRCQVVQCDESLSSLREGSVTCTAEHFYDSVCTARCNPGYQFDAESLTNNARKNNRNDASASVDALSYKCLQSGEWDGEKPTCIKHSCVPRVATMIRQRSNGEISCTDGELFLSVCQLTCAEGYEITEGMESTQCTETRQWSTTLGQCTRVRCQEFEPLDNGRTTCTNSNLYESTCSFECSSGYDLVGESSSTCRSDRKFSNSMPTCRKIECPQSHTMLVNGNAECSDGFRFESRCVYVCNPGYEMIGAPSTSVADNVAVLTCMADRTWGGELPRCRRKRCSSMDGALTRAAQNGEVTCTEETFFRSVCSVVCKVGHQLVGPPSTRCTATADWGPTLGYCEKIQCPSLRVPQNGAMTCTDSNRYQSECAFRCQVGFERIGAPSSTCQADRTFSNEEPRCNEITCDATFTTLQNGQARCSNGNKFASRCEYTCHNGYELTERSASAAVCLVTYSWDASTPPTCVKKRCSQADPIILTAIENGNAVCTDENRFESQCTLTCNEGYELSGGSGVTVCMANQMWRDNFGYCQKIRCPQLDELVNGATMCSDENRYQSRCNFTCDPGYELSGSDTSVCQADRAFSNPLPKCQKTRCPVDYLTIANGIAQCSDENLFQSVCEYACSAGYEITSGNEKTRCEEDQTWSQDKAVCEKKICPSNDINLQRADLNGLVTCTEGHVFGSICSVACDVGYELFAGASVSTRCNENAVWDSAIGYCIKIRCPEFDSLVNGATNCSDSNRFLSSCEFECDPGYEMAGSPLSTCQADETWTSPLPVCSKIRCTADYLSLEDGAVQCTDANLYQSTCSYECDRGYEVAETDVTSATCQATETWSNPKPTCSKRRCPLNNLNLLRAGDTGSVTCTEENFYLSVCSVECPIGYELVEGSQRIVCLDSARWSSEIGYCRKIRCQEVARPENGDIECTDSNLYESICGFSCNAGYYLVGNDQITCQADRSFSRAVPVCEKISCPEDHLTIRLGTVSCSEGNLFGSVCEYRCNNGYEFLDSEFVAQETVMAECLSVEEWDVDVPICEKKTCSVREDEAFLSALNQGAAGAVSCAEGNRFGSVCSLQCAPGHEAEGNSAIECSELGVWNSSIGICTMIECPPQDAPVDGALNCTDNFNFETECLFTCDEGHQFVEEGRVQRDEEGNFLPPPSTITAECTEERTWTVVHTPQCEKKLCPLEGWDSLSNGNVSCSDGNRYLSTCFYQCQPGYVLYKPKDDVSITSVLVTCTSSGLWDVEETPTCVRRQCSPSETDMQEVEEHGVVTCTNGSRFESQCDLVCNRGYHLRDGRNSTVCQSDGEWSVAIDPCEKSECPPLEPPAHSTVTCTNDYLFKSHCKVRCDDGYEIVDPEEEYDQEKGISCRSDGSWCGELPMCAKMTCSEDHLRIESGSVECTDANVFESVCSYTCDLGFHMIQGQSDSSRCGDTGLWTSTVPVCENNRCPANDSSLTEAQENGEVTCTNENKFGSQCLLHCFDGYEMTGEYTTACQHDRTWSNGLGLCRKISCEPFQSPPNTTLMCTDEYRFQSSCVFKCLPGYLRTDEVPEDLAQDITCTADGSWTGTVRYCQKLICPSEGYEVVENGRVRCSDGHFFASECLFSCNPGYQLVDRFDKDLRDPSIRCTTAGTWSLDEAPRCIPSECFPTAEEMSEAIEHGALSCTRSSEFGSRCTLSCDEGYTADGEYAITECEANNQWWPLVGACKKIECSEMPLPLNVEEIQCSDGNNFGSACFATRCRPGCVVRFPERNLRTCTEQGHWSGPELECSGFIECPTSYLELDNGHVTCSDNNRFESQCDFYCDPSYELSTNRDRTVCQANGEWSIEKPACVARRTCTSTYFSLGIVSCDASGSCQLDCDPGTDLVGSGRSRCDDNNGVGPIRWNPPLGECRKRSCHPLIFDPNVEVSCSDGFLFRSSCRFRCKSGFTLRGHETVSCASDGGWSNSAPTCEAITCSTDYMFLSKGRSSPTDYISAGSVVRFSCTQEGYELIGASVVTCLLGGQWSDQKPVCRLGRCPPLHLLNGGVECDRGVHNEYGSRCRYTCNDLYQIQGESEITECGFDGQWSNTRPYCRGHCDTNFADFDNGFVFCTDSNWHNSKCSFSCGSIGSIKQPFQLYGSEEVTCQEDGRWSEAPPCCAKPCPPSGKIDMFFVLDSSDSVGYDNWTKVLDFVNQIVSSFNVGDDDLQVGVVRYHRDVASRDEIPLGRYSTSSTLRNSIRFLNYGGFGTNTGRALRYVTRYSLRAASNRRDARDYVILITDGSSQDSVTAPAQQLKNTGATVYTVGVAGSRLDRDELSVIATSSNDVFIAENGFDDLSSSLVERVTSNLCENPCLLNKKYRESSRNYLPSPFP